MKYMVVGPGALGCLVATYISRGQTAKDSLYLLDHNLERVQLLNQQGIRYEWEETSTDIPIETSASPEELGVVDVILICVKSYDIDRTLGFCQPLLQTQPLILFLQNGIAHLKVSKQLKTDCGFVSSTEGATRLGPGHIKHAGKGITHMGFLESVSPKSIKRLEQIFECLQQGGMDIHIDADIRTRLWAKLFVNVGINALTAIHQCKNGQLLTLPGVTNTMQKAIEEAMKVARTSGITISQDPFQLALSVCRRTAKNVSSMLQDVRAKRPTEIDAINGAVIEEAQILGIDVPVNRRLVEKVKEIENTYLK